MPSASSSTASPATAQSTQQRQQQQQYVSDKVRVSGYLSERCMDERVDALLADKQLTLDSVAELRQQARDEQWLDDWQHLDAASASRSPSAL